MRTGNCLDRLKKLLNQKRGTTMMELLVAFVVVMTVMVMFSRIVSVSIRMFQSAQTMIQETEDFNEQYYRTVNYEARPASAGSLVLSVDMAKTQDSTAAGADLLLNAGSSIVFWKNAAGYDMYALSVKEYEPAPVPGE